MKMHLFSIYDVKAEAYTPPFAGRTVSEGLRTFGYALKDQQLQYHRDPGDYRLFRVGEFDPVSGVVTALKEGIALLEEGLQLVKEA